MTTVTFARPPRTHVLAVTFICTCTVMASGEAQEEAPAAALEEIVVTAGFRAHDLMTSPGSVTVIDQAIIDDRAAQHLESVLNTSPNISYSSGASRARFVQIRGVGDLEQFADPKHFPA